MCRQQGRLKEANVVDHIQPHKDDTVLFWDQNNWQSLCFAHHNSSKQTEEKRGYASVIGNDGWPTDPRHPVNKI